MTNSVEKTLSVVSSTPKRRGRPPKSVTSAASGATSPAVKAPLDSTDPMTPVPSEPSVIPVSRALLHGSYYVNETMAKELQTRKAGVLNIQLHTNSGVLKVEFAKKPDEAFRKTVYLPPNAWQQVDARLSP